MNLHEHGARVLVTIVFLNSCRLCACFQPVTKAALVQCLQIHTAIVSFMMKLPSAMLAPVVADTAAEA